MKFSIPPDRMKATCYVPDVVIRLPENKHIIIDAKVSLIAYEQYISADVPEERDRFLKAYCDSVRNHIKGLGDKNYQHAEAMDTPDFVLLFMPIEPAFSAAMQFDGELFNFAWERKIVIVSPYYTIGYITDHCIGLET